MTKLDSEQEKDAIDLITNCMLSLGFLQSISDVIFGPHRNQLTVGQFYDQWLGSTGAPEGKVPFNLGAILGYLYCGILFAKENWFDLLSDIDLATADPKWGISGNPCISPKTPNPSLKYAVRRIRNALGHGHIAVDVPKDIQNRSELMTRVTIQFHDVNMRDATDTFDMSISLERLTKFVREFQSIVYDDVRSRM